MFTKKGIDGIEQMFYNERTELKGKEPVRVVTESKKGQAKGVDVEQEVTTERANEQIKRIVHKLLLLNTQTREKIISDYLKRHR